MPLRPNVSFIMLVKSALIITIPTLVILITLLIFGTISFDSLFYSYSIILFSTACIIMPFLKNINILTDYVNDLAEGRHVKEPQLKYLNAISDLPNALIRHHHAWEKKEKHTASLITEYEILVNSLPDILIMCNKDQKIVRTNKAARDRFGQNLSGEPISSIIPNDDLLNGIAAVIAERRGYTFSFHVELATPCDFHAIIELFPTASAEGIAVIITLNDITELKRVEKMRADFVANASHEIRTPLASIKGFIETLRGPAKDDPAAHDEFLRIMDEQATRMKKLIDDLLTLSKIEMNERSIPLGKVDIAQIVRGEKEAFAWAAKEKNMVIRVDIADNLLPAQGDENELRQVVHNLVGNAIKYGNAETEVVVNARVTPVLPDDPNFTRSHRAICISVIDSGHGIAREHLPRLTERFYRVASAGTRNISGTGLGLAIVKHIINRHHGVLTIESVVGQGSTFSVYLQVYEEE